MSSASHWGLFKKIRGGNGAEFAENFRINQIFTLLATKFAKYLPM